MTPEPSLAGIHEVTERSLAYRRLLIAAVSAGLPPELAGVLFDQLECSSTALRVEVDHFCAKVTARLHGLLAEHRALARSYYLHGVALGLGLGMLLATAAMLARGR